VLALCKVESFSGGKGAVRGVLDPDEESISNGERRAFPVDAAEGSAPELLGRAKP